MFTCLLLSETTLQCYWFLLFTSDCSVLLVLFYSKMNGAFSLPSKVGIGFAYSLLSLDPILWDYTWYVVAVVGYASNNYFSLFFLLLHFTDQLWNSHLIQVFSSCFDVSLCYWALSQSLVKQ